MILPLVHTTHSLSLGRATRGLSPERATRGLSPERARYARPSPERVTSALRARPLARARYARPSPERTTRGLSPERATRCLSSVAESAQAKTPEAKFGWADVISGAAQAEAEGQALKPLKIGQKLSCI